MMISFSLPATSAFSFLSLILLQLKLFGCFSSLVLSCVFYNEMMQLFLLSEGSQQHKKDVMQPSLWTFRQLVAGVEMFFFVVYFALQKWLYYDKIT